MLPVPKRELPRGQTGGTVWIVAYGGWIYAYEDGTTRAPHGQDRLAHRFAIGGCGPRRLRSNPGNQAEFVPMLRRLSLLWRTFTSVEEALLTAVADALPSESATLLRGQIASITRVQRTLDWTEILFYSMRGGRVNWPETVLFPNRGETRLANLNYRVDGRSFRSTVHSISGHVFSLVTRPSIKEFCFGEVKEMVVADLGDMLYTSEGHKAQRILPSTYLAYVERGEPAETSNGWTILQPNETYVVHLLGSDFYILAARQGNEWLLGSGNEGDQSIYLCTTEGEPEPVASEFDRALQR
jgi:hypothetical protein